MVWVIAYALSILLANWSLDRYGLLNIGPWLIPAGSFWAGLTFSFRDLAQDRLGWRWTAVAVAVGAAVSWFVAPSFAAASGAAFLLAESLDLAVYTPLRRRGWLRAVACSNVVGFVADTVLFLWLVGFLSRPAVQGQLVAKGAMTVLALVVLWGWRRGAVLRGASSSAPGGTV